MRRLLLLILLGSMTAGAQDKTPYKFMFAGNSYSGPRSATVTWLAERFDAGISGLGDWPGMLDSIYEASQSMSKEFWCGPYASSHEINLYDRFNSSLQYNERLTNLQNNWLYVYAKHYLDSVGISVESLVVHISDDYVNITQDGDGTRSYSLTGLPYHKRRFTYQYWNNTASDTMFYPAGYTWLANGYNADARRAIAYAFRRHLIEDSAAYGPGNHHWTAFFMDNQYREGFAPRLYSYYSINATSGGPTTGLDWYEQPGIGTDFAANTRYYDLSTMLIDSTVRAVLDSTCDANGLRRIHPFANVDKFSPVTLGVQLRHTNVTLENPVDYTKAWPNGWRQWYLMADSMAAHPERYICWLLQGDIICSSNPADWKYDSSRVYMMHYAFFLQVRDTNAFVSPFRFNDTTRWRGIYSVDFGEPDGAAYEISSVGSAYSKLAVMRRDYNNSNVVVLLRTSHGQADWINDSVAVNLHNLYSHYDADGTISSAADSVYYLKPYTGIILRLAEPCSGAPSVPVWSSPSPGSSVGTTPVVCVQNSSHGDCPDPVRYQFQIATDASFSQIVRQSTWISEGSGTTCYAGGILDEGERYYWRCRATNGTATSRWSGGFDFVTPNTPPPSPVGASPEDQGIAFTPQPILSVNNVDDPDGTPVVYAFQVSEFSSFSSLTAQSGLVPEGTGATTSWQVNKVLNDGRTYFWRARAYDDIVYSAWMPVRSFTVDLSDSNVVAIGDINVNGIANEVADAVMFSNFFVQGLSAFGNHPEASTAASDINLDGAVLSIADLVYQVRLIVAETGASPKPRPPGDAASVTLRSKNDGILIGMDSPVDVGGAYFVFGGAVDRVGIPYLTGNAADMSLKYSIIGDRLSILVYSLQNGRMISAGAADILSIPMLGDGALELEHVEISDYRGSLLKVKTDGPGQVPDRFILEQNHPNPFNAGTTIRYQLSAAAHVNLDIFNILGERIAVLIDGWKSAGAHQVEWDGADTSGKPAASGIYIYRLAVDGHHAQKKMILMK